MSSRINTLEQKAIECHVEIVGKSEIKNEQCTNIIEKINTKFGTKVITKNIF